MKKRKDWIGLSKAIDYKKDSFNPRHLRVRKAVIDVVTELGGSAAVDMLHERLKLLFYGPNEIREEIRLYMIKALGNIDDPKAVGVLLDLMNHYLPAPEFTAAEEALRHKGPDAFNLLIVRGVRYSDEGCEFLRKMGYQATQAEMDALISDLDSKDQFRHAVAAGMLGRLRDMRGFDPLVRNLTRSDGYGFGNHVVEALGDFGDPRAVEPLLGIIGDLNREEKAIEIIGKLGDERAIPALTKRIERGGVSGTNWGLHAISLAEEAIESIRQRTQSNKASVKK